MDIKNAATPIYDPSMKADRALYDKRELTLLNNLENFQNHQKIKIDDNYFCPNCKKIVSKDDEICPYCKNKFH